MSRRMRITISDGELKKHLSNFQGTAASFELLRLATNGLNLDYSQKRSPDLSPSNQRTDKQDTSPDVDASARITSRDEISLEENMPTNTLVDFGDAILNM